MSLADIAAADARKILNADGCVITLQSPDGRFAELKGNSQDIGHQVSTETGMFISGRTCTVVVHLADLAAVNMAPKGESDAGGKKPWVVKYVETVSRAEHTFKVTSTEPDRTIGALKLILEFYKSQP